MLFYYVRQRNTVCCVCFANICDVDIIESIALGNQFRFKLLCLWLCIEMQFASKFATQRILYNLKHY